MTQATDIVEEGKTRAIVSGTLIGSGTSTYTFVSKSSGVTLSVFVSAVTTSIKIDMYTGTTDKSVKIVNVPLIKSPTQELLLYSPATSLSNCYVVITWEGTATAEILIKGSSLPSGASTSANQDLMLAELQSGDQLMYRMVNEFEEMNKSLKIIIKQLSYITEQDED